MTTPMRISMAAALVVAGAFAQTDQKTNNENMVHDRGQTRVRSHQGQGAPSNAEVSGILIDAGCKDRSAFNMRRTPENVRNATPPNEGAADRAAYNQTITGDVLEHQVPDLFSRQSDPTCAITGVTHAFALLTSDGKLLDLDEGGNTLAAEAVTDTPQGRDMLNGKAYGFKPKVTVTGRRLTDRIYVDNLKVAQ